MRLGGVLLLLKAVGGVPDLAAFGPTAPDNVLELTSGDRKAAREAMRRHPTRFAVLMMAPRVGSKMLWSQLRSYRPGIVHMLMEGNDARLKDELPNATVAERVEALLSKAEAIAIRRTPHHRGRLLCGNQPVCRVHSAMTRPRWPRRAVRNRHRHAGGVRPTRRFSTSEILICTQVGPRRSASRPRRAACGTPRHNATGRRPSTTTRRRRPSRTFGGARACASSASRA